VPDIFVVVLDLNELDSKQVLVYIQDCGNDDGDREIFLHKRFVKVERLLDIDAVIVPVMAPMSEVLQH
jgi:hypothetical protein